MAFSDSSDALEPAGARHVACIMDGNGRWATQRGLGRIDGYRASEAAIMAVVDAAIEKGVNWLTLFAFSTENWERPAEEVAFLMELNARLIERYALGFRDRGIRVRYLGRQTAPIPAPVLSEIQRIQDLTAENTTLNLTFAFNYGGRSEMVDAVRRLLQDGTPPSQVDERAIASHLQYPEMPDPDVIVRTGGEHRLSNFLLWGAAYAELFFLDDVLWPDMRSSHLHAVLESYERRRRTFGALRPGPSPARVVP